MTLMTRKFSQFVNGGQIVSTDEPVGLEAGANTIWTGAAGGGGGNSQVLPQPVPPVAAGDWVRIVQPTGLYTGAEGDNAGDAEVVGLVVSANATTFTLQQSGYVTAAMAVPGISALTPGLVYFLSTAAPATMIPQDALVNGQVSRPVFVADTPDSGWILPYRGLIVGGAAPSGTGGSGDSNLHTVNQPLHDFGPGTVLRVSTINGAGQPITYTRAQANTLANAQAVGIVVINPPPSANQFTIQFAGYNANSLTTDYLDANLAPSTVYYLSATNPGLVTSIDPELSGGISKPIYITEQGLINAGQNSGYILPQRPLTNANAPMPVSVLLGTITASNSPAVQFNNLLTPAYNTYFITFANVCPSVFNAALLAQVGTGNLPTYQNAGYLGVGYSVDPFGLTAVVSTPNAFQLTGNMYNAPAAIAYGGAGSMYLYNANTVTAYKSMNAQSTYFSGSSMYNSSNLSQYWTNTTTITSLQFLMNAGNIVTGTFSLYGLNQ